MCGALNENIKGLGVNGLPQADIQAEPVNPVIRLATLASDDMAAVEAVIEERMASATRSIPQTADYLVAAGGKRIRPLITVTAARMLGYEGDGHVSLAAAVEYIHSATLLHDDVVDESDMRRGLDTANVVWGNKASVLVGDFLFSRSFQLMVADGSLEVLRILSTASAVIAEGEVHQLLTSNNTDTGESAYLEVITGKTAQLFAAAAEVGAVVADRPKVEREALASFGLNLGLAFQLVDDALDYSAEQAKLGKSVGDDFREGKITLPIILAFRRGNEAEREFWRRTVERLEQTDADLAEAQKLIRKHGALEDTIARARHYAAVSKDALGIFPDGPIKAALEDVIDFCVERAY